MYVCSCRAVTDRTIRTALMAGADSVEEITRMCAAGARCGGCWPELERLLEQHRVAGTDEHDDRIAV